MPEAIQPPNPNHGQWLMQNIWERLNEKNEHFMGVIVGQEGSGKSYTATKIAHEIDPTFDADRIIFDIAELLKRLRDGEYSKGQMVVLDEAGVQLGKRTWQDRAQVLANQALQLIRDHNLGLIFTLPRLSELDSQTQGRLQAMIEMTHKRDGEWAEAKWKWLDPDRTGQTGKVYQKYPRRYHNGKQLKIKKVRFTPPPSSIIEPYESRKDEFQAGFYQEVIDALGDETEDDEDGDDEMSPKEIASDIMESDIEQYVSRHGSTKRPYVDKELIRADYECTHDDAKAAKGLIERDLDDEEIESYA